MTQKPKLPLPKGFTAPSTSSSTATATDLLARLNLYIKEQVDNCPLLIEEVRDALIRETEAADRYAKELADLRSAHAIALQNIENARRDEQRNCDRLRAEIERLTEEEIPR